MVTWTTGKTGWAVMVPSGAFVAMVRATVGGKVVAVQGESWSPEGASTWSRAHAFRVAKRLGGKAVQLVSVQEWDAQYAAKPVPMPSAAQSTQPRRARGSRKPARKEV